MEKENPEEKGAFTLIISVLAGLSVIGIIFAAWELGITTALEVFAMYAVLICVVFLICYIPMSFMLKRMDYYSVWRLLASVALFLFDAIVFVTVLISYIRPWAYGQAGIAVTKDTDPAFMFLNITGALAIMMAAFWSIHKNKKVMLEKAGKIDN